MCAKLDHPNLVLTLLPHAATPPALLLSVLRAHPVLELATENGSVSVEMNPEDEWRVRQIIEEDCMRCAAAGPGGGSSRDTCSALPLRLAAVPQVLTPCCSLPNAASCRTVGW